VPYSCGSYNVSSCVPPGTQRDVLFLVNFGYAAGSSVVSMLDYAKGALCRFAEPGSRSGLIIYGAFVNVSIPLRARTHDEWQLLVQDVIDSAEDGALANGTSPLAEALALAYGEFTSASPPSLQLPLVEVVTASLPQPVPYALQNISLPSPWTYPYADSYLGSYTCVGTSAGACTQPVPYNQYLSANLTEYVELLQDLGVFISVLLVPAPTANTCVSAMIYQGQAGFASPACTSDVDDPTTPFNFCAFFEQGDGSPSNPAVCHCSDVVMAIGNSTVCAASNTTVDLLSATADAMCFTFSPSSSPSQAPVFTATFAPTRRPTRVEGRTASPSGASALSNSPTMMHPTASPLTCRNGYVNSSLCASPNVTLTYNVRWSSSSSSCLTDLCVRVRNSTTYACHKCSARHVSFGTRRFKCANAAGQQQQQKAMGACCRNRNETASKSSCEYPSTYVQPKCRAVALSNAVCATASSCKGKTMTLKLSFETNNQTCCSSCTCYGDPHCESFAGKSDTWVVCDAREAVGLTGRCTETRAMCLKQLDNAGSTCVWTPPPATTTWNVALQGSECMFANPQVPPQMTMYQADNFSLTLVLGERAVITGITVKDVNSGAGGYYLSAQNCMFPNGQFAWRNSTTAKSPVTSATWLPYTFEMGVETGGDVIWTVATLPSQVALVIRCTHTAVQNSQGTGVSYGTPRINVEQLAEPLNYLTQRSNVSGFCPSSVIAKQGSHANTDYITANKLCTIQAASLVVAKLLCSPATTSGGVATCQSTWCSSIRPNLQACLLDITTYGWDQTYCAAKTVTSQLAVQCSSVAACMKCVNTIADFGWYDAILEYANVQVTSSTCYSRAHLPKALLSCQAGVNIQYQQPSGAWVTYLAVPSFYTLCSGQVSFSAATDSVMFLHPVRVQQCSLGPACVTDLCAHTFGFTAAFSLPAPCSRGG